jgi:hypothetical protein
VLSHPWEEIDMAYKKQTQQDAAPRRFGRIPEAAERARVSPRQIMKWMREGKVIPLRPSGGVTLIDLQQLDAFLLGSATV